VPTSAVEHETDEKAPAHGAEAQRQDVALPVAERDGSMPVAELSNAPPALLHPRLLLGLQAMAGNAAVANLIETRRPAPAPAPVSPTRETAPDASTSPAPLADGNDISNSPPPLGEGREGALRAEHMFAKMLGHVDRDGAGSTPCPG
jgi:hypothetical protein